MVWNFVSGLFKWKSGKAATDPDGAVNGKATPPLGGERNRPIQLVIGLDFGTSFSKVVIGEPRARRAVPFDVHAIGENPYLLPSALCVDPEDGKCLLGTDRQGGTVHDNLKMPLIEGDFSLDVQGPAAAFLALVLRHAIAWLLDTHGKIYRDRTINWFVNVGLPTDSYDNTLLKSAYLSIVRTAWTMSVSNGDVTLQRTLDLLKQDGAHPDGQLPEAADPALLLPHDRFHAFPEFSAQLAGYVNSPRRRKGLHVTVDVGGGTLDVTVFNVHEDEGEDVFPIFARQVEPLGVRYHAADRLHALQLEIDREYSPFDDFPSDARFQERYGITEAQLTANDKSFRSKVATAIADELRYTRRCRYPNAPQWELASDSYGDPVPSFFSGGGSSAEFYAKLLREFGDWDPPLKLGASELPVPDDIEFPGMAPKGYARLAVAYGLSLDPFNIGQIRSKSEVEDRCADKVQPTYGDNYVGPEQT